MPGELTAKGGGNGDASKFESGDFFVDKIPMGYKRDNDEWLVVSEDTNIIRKIYLLYLEGSTLQQIKEYLEEYRIKTATERSMGNSSYSKDTEEREI